MKVKDIIFQSADHVIQEIRDMNVKGGSPFGRAAAWAFKLVCDQEKLETKEELFNRFEDVANQMVELKPTMATIYNTYHMVLKTVEKYKNEGIDKIKTEVSAVCGRIIKYSFDSVDQLAVYGSNLIKDGDVVMMHSYSSTLMGIFINAANAGKKFKVICTESRPLRESRVAVRILQKLHVDVIYVTDASIYEIMPKADYIIMGADSLCVDGSVANKMGTAMISHLAQSCKKPVYIASELYKLDLRTKNGYQVKLERRSEWEIIKENDFESLDGVDIINQFFDLTPAIEIKAIICEYGVVSPNSLMNYWNELETNIMEAE